MSNLLFGLCLLSGLICTYAEYYWMRHDYRSLVLVASKCPKPSIDPLRAPVHDGSRNAKATWFWQLFSPIEDRSLLPVTCETMEIHTNPRSVFLLVKLLCLVALIWKILSHLRIRSTIVRTSLITIGDGPEQVREKHLFHSIRRSTWQRMPLSK